MVTSMRGGMSYAVENTVRTIFKRCVVCPPGKLTCPTCPGTQICSLVPQDCQNCARMACIEDPSPVAPPPHQGPNVGAIAGGVVGGVAFVALIVFLIWRFWIKKRREQQDRELEQEFRNDDIAAQKRGHHLSTNTPDAGSTRTRGSLAASFLSRASNIIQIAYIPGVTNRNGSNTNSIHAPVPPIPAAHRQAPPKSPLSNQGDELFFGIGDLRGSTYSGNSSIRSGNTDRDTRYTSNRDTRYTMHSITPSLARDSIASEVYFDDAAATPMPATTAARLAPRMVSVKSSNASSATSTYTPESTSTPGSPPQSISSGNNPPKVLMPTQGLSPSSSIAGGATQVSASNNNSKKGRFPIRQPSDASSTNHAPTISSPLATNDTTQPLLNLTDFSPRQQPIESPFFDASEHPSAAAIAAASSTRPNPYASMASTIGAGSPPRHRGKSGMGMGGLSAVIEEATKRASQDGVASAKALREESPFGDEHRTEEAE